MVQIDEIVPMLTDEIDDAWTVFERIRSPRPPHDDFSLASLLSSHLIFRSIPTQKARQVNEMARSRQNSQEQIHVSHQHMHREDKRND